MKIKLLAIFVIIVAMVIIIGYRAEPKPQPSDNGPVEEEPAERPAPLHIEPVEPIKPIEHKIPEPLPLPKKLPPGVKCLDDCPLIEPEQEVAYVERKVRDVFKDTPVLVEIARCESHFRHYNPETGEVLKNPNSSALGVMQVMESYHAEPARNLGLDIRDLEGNLYYAKSLYETQGTTPWESSQNCWGSAIVALNKVISDNS